MNYSIVILLFFFPFFLRGQTASNFQVDLFTIQTEQDTISLVLTKNFLIASTLKIKNDTVVINDFRFDRQSNSVTIFSPNGFPINSELTISYHFLPISIRQEYRLRTLAFKRDSSKVNGIIPSTYSQESGYSNLFGSELSKSGSIHRGFFVGSNRDFTLSSGFRLQMVGKLSEEIDIVAALTDENTPIQPQGNTQTLQEIDNVFIEIRSPHYIATLGDFQYSNNGSELFSINRKLQGARIDADHQSLFSGNKVTITGATARGKFNSKSISGIEGVQGPYRLSGQNNERNIIVIAGTEKVYVDGEIMLRGENNDYTIDYGSSEVTFTTGRLITGASRIVIDYEYSDRQYTRNMIGIHSSTSLTKSLTVKANYFREGDDQDAPIDIILNEEEKKILRETGSKVAIKSGIFFVGVDSNGIGKGNYSRIDTLINSKQVHLYRYETGLPTSIFNVSFSHVGIGNGDYQRESIGKYKFIGSNAGTYSPIIQISSPQLQQNYSFQSLYSFNENLSFDGEFAASNSDLNRFSSIGDAENTGTAIKLKLRYASDKISIGDVKIGSIEISLYERFIESRYSSMDRLNAVDFGRKWSTDSLAINLNTSEEIREGKILYSPLEGLATSGNIGTLDREGQFSSFRYDGSIHLTMPNYPKLFYFAEVITGNENVVNITNDWTRQKGSVEYDIFLFTPSFRFENEHRSVRINNTDSILSPSIAFTAYSPKLMLKGLSAIEASTEYEWRYDDAFYEGNLKNQSSSLTQLYTFKLRETNNVSFSAIVTLRNKKYERDFQSNNSNQQTTLIKLLSRYRPFSGGIDIDGYYDVSTQKTAMLERFFYKVLKGEGQYLWIDSNNNGIADLNDETDFRLSRYDGEYNAIYINSDNLRPVINLKTSARFKIIPQRIIDRPDGYFQKSISIISMESYFRLEERSTEPQVHKIYFLDPRSFQRPATTLYGLQFIQQDIYFFENKTEFSFRFRYNQKIGLNQFSTGLEKNYSRERSIRTRFQISNDLVNQTDLIIRNDNALSTSMLNRSRQISSMAIVTDLSYRPEINLELGFKVENSESKDSPLMNSVLADFNSQSVRIVYGFLGNGQIRSEFTRDEVLLRYKPADYLSPYELTAGREIGKQYQLEISSEYKLVGNIQFSIQYFGRTSRKIGIIHTGKMEIRAFF